MDNRDNRRKNERVSFATPIKIFLEIEGQRMELTGSSRNLSTKGLYLDTDHPFEPGTRCLIKIFLTGTREKIEMPIQGTIVRQADKGMGIMFDSMDVDTYAHLKKIVAYNSMA